MKHVISDEEIYRLLREINLNNNIEEVDPPDQISDPHIIIKKYLEKNGRSKKYGKIY